MVGKEIKKQKPDVFTSLFWHIPWPHPDTFKECPWNKEILEGLLGNDLLGFQIEDYCDNFMDTVREILDAEVNENIIKYKGHKTLVKAFPISVDFDLLNKKSQTKEVKNEIKKIKKETPYKFMGLGIDRIDYSKGIPEKLKAVKRFLEKYPEYQKNFVYVELGAPSRTKIPAYHKINEEIETLIEEINKKYETIPWQSSWKPIKYVKKKVSLSKVLAYYRRADICIVSSLKDGMNLVAKEYVAANKNGVLILSPFTGASRELDKALIVNPYNTEEFADTIKKALEMKKDEKRERMKILRKSVKENDIYKWVKNIFFTIIEMQK